MSKAKVSIVGCGWLGTALGLAVKSALKDVEVIGHDKNSANQRRAEQLKAIDKGNWNLPSACEDAQLVILAIPRSEVEATLRAVGQYLSPDTLVVDTSGSALPILNGPARSLPANVAFISTDIVLNPVRVPIALPVEQLTPQVFSGSAWSVVPRAGTSEQQINILIGLISALDAYPIFTDAAEHDGLRLGVEAVPAALAAALMNAVMGDEAARERQWLAGVSFASATVGVESLRAADIAQSMIEQRDAAVHWLNQVMLAMMDMRDAAQKGDQQRLEALLSKASERRDHWLNAWAKGRESEVPRQTQPNQPLSSIFLGQKLANELARKPPK